ncbi:galactose oxidase [Meredithblackwellia eburnea MCA 4105]
MVTLAAKWTRISLQNAPALKLSSHSLAVIKDNAFIFGGELKPRTPVSSDVTVISLKDGSTRTISPPSPSSPWPSARVGAGLTQNNGKLYLWGGRGGKDMGTFNDDEDVWAFDPTSESWQSLTTNGDRPQQRSFHALTSQKPDARPFFTPSGNQDSLYLHAGCPPKGRLATLHSLSLPTLTWKELPSAPEPARGGTVLAPLLQPGGTLARFGGFAGFELGGPLELFDTAKEEWTVVEAGNVVSGEEGPAKRSVHGLLPFKSEVNEDIVAVMVMGEREGAPAALGHDGAGAFHADAWALLSRPSGTYSWLSLPPSKDTTETPEARGWFASSTWGTDKVIVHGGLNEKNERLDDLWVLEVVQQD